MHAALGLTKGWAVISNGKTVRQWLRGRGRLRHELASLQVVWLLELQYTHALHLLAALYTRRAHPGKPPPLTMVVIYEFENDACHYSQSVLPTASLMFYRRIMFVELVKL